MDSVSTGPLVIKSPALYACSEELSRGRQYNEPAPTYRNQYQRDRDRIIHCAAFRRLEYKTQVFVNHEGDLFRTRLTHSIEVAQIARTAARILGLNEDLVEAISLAHDLGHTPFGHAGQEALNECMRNYGGFEHNLQSLRVVDLLEEKYAEFDGLNLMHDTREGILKHCSKANAKMLGTIGERFLTEKQPSLEAQLANICDEIAYNNHDVDDGLRSGLITVDQLMEVSLFRHEFNITKKMYPTIGERRCIHEIIRHMINRQVTDLVNQTHENISKESPRSANDIRNTTRKLTRFSEDMLELHMQLKQFLNENLYHHNQVQQVAIEAKKLVKSIFELYMNDTLLLPENQRARLKHPDPWRQNECSETHKARVVSDFIAGMTDRYAFAERNRLFS